MAEDSAVPHSAAFIPPSRDAIFMGASIEVSISQKIGNTGQ